ncbi:MAG: mechanosensitive ion channel [Deltaproteobacteria bacterium]|nr:mechanosensitive ion channel [Deltaproteobacteria bacterium]
MSKANREARASCPQIGASVLLFIASCIGAVILEKIIRHVNQQRGQPQDVLDLVAKTARMAVIVFGAVTALGTMGINVSALVAGLGLTGFALGFALKDIISNMLSGILILAYHPFRRGDHIGVAGLDGIVSEIDLRYTTLHAEEKTILLPNSTLFTNPISVSTSKASARARRIPGA